MQKMKATLILENGMTFAGRSIGSGEERICEMVFNTSMTGYQEILTDPSYAGQGVVMSYPLIGNYGVNHEDNESSRPWVEAFVVRHLSPRGSNFRCEGDLNTYLKEHDITGIQGVDTRALTKILRSQGSMNGMLTCAEHFNVAEVMERLRSYEVKDTVRKVTRTQPEVFEAYGEEKHLVAVMDYGVKQNIIECLRRRGCKVVALPAYTPVGEVLSGGFDGVMLSNGPGDPEQAGPEIELLRQVLDAGYPFFGICFGNQLLGRALGFGTYKLKFGHRGINQPVKDLTTGKVEVTAHNHGFAVDAPIGKQVDAPFENGKYGKVFVSHIDLNDNVVEGLQCVDIPAFSVQYHPEAAAGPHDAAYLFDRFVDLMRSAKEGTHNA